MHDLGLIESVPPWYSPVKPKPVYEADSGQVFWDVPVFALLEEVTENRVDVRIIDYQTKRIITLEISCPWIPNRTNKTAEKTLKYGPLRWVGTKAAVSRIRNATVLHHHGCPQGLVKDLDVTMQELGGSRSRKVLQKHAEGGVIGIPEYFPDF